MWPDVGIKSCPIVSKIWLISSHSSFYNESCIFHNSQKSWQTFGQLGAPVVTQLVEQSLLTHEDTRFKSSHRNNLFTINCILNCIEKTKIKKNVAENGPIKKIFLYYSEQINSSTLVLYFLFCWQQKQYRSQLCSANTSRLLWAVGSIPNKWCANTTISSWGRSGLIWFNL